MELAHRLDMKVVVEGVETKEQAELLRNYGYDFFQGLLLFETDS
ncbi:MAG: EAL domain-containing protein [Blautia sp.]